MMKVFSNLVHRAAAVLGVVAFCAGCLFAGSARLAVAATCPQLAHQGGVAPLCVSPTSNPTATPPSTPVPTTAPTSTPGPGGPSDATLLVQIANGYAGACSGQDTSCTDHLAVVNGWALVGFTDKVNSGEVFLARKVNGTWSVIAKGGGWLIQSDLQAFGVDATTAAQLESAASPTWTGS